ncbi:MAG: hypothetical protein QOH21_1170 [Acidobacteriota bacterium]|jgi:hypothetical protein|nr:hypothetical protein [Acidobacteriota bacterium]
MDSKSPFVKLDEQVSLASSTPRVIRTSEAGRVIGFGCSSAEESAFKSLESFIRDARNNPPADFEAQLHQHVQKFQQAVVSDHKQNQSQNK